MNETIIRKLMEAKHPFRSIKQWYKRVVNLDRHWRKSRSEESIRSRKEMGLLVPRQNIAFNITGIQ